jgi:hypothetical protein
MLIAQRYAGSLARRCLRRSCRRPHAAAASFKGYVLPTEKDAGIAPGTFLPTDSADQLAAAAARGMVFSVKQTATDFVVREIDPSGKVVCITDPLRSEAGVATGWDGNMAPKALGSSGGRDSTAAAVGGSGATTDDAAAVDELRKLVSDAIVERIRSFVAAHIRHRLSKAIHARACCHCRLLLYLPPARPPLQPPPSFHTLTTTADALINDGGGSVDFVTFPAPADKEERRRVHSLLRCAWPAQLLSDTVDTARSATSGGGGGGGGGGAGGGGGDGGGGRGCVGAAGGAGNDTATAPPEAVRLMRVWRTQQRPSSSFFVDGRVRGDKRRKGKIRGGRPGSNSPSSGGGTAATGGGSGDNAHGGGRESFGRMTLRSEAWEYPGAEED